MEWKYGRSRNRWLGYGMVRYVICPDEDIWYIWSDNARQRMTLILNVLLSVEICFYLLCK